MKIYSLCDDKQRKAEATRSAAIYNFDNFGFFSLNDAQLIALSPDDWRYIIPRLRITSIKNVSDSVKREKIKIMNTRIMKVICEIFITLSFLQTNRERRKLQSEHKNVAGFSKGESTKYSNLAMQLKNKIEEAYISEDYSEIEEFLEDNFDSIRAAVEAHPTQIGKLIKRTPSFFKSFRESLKKEAEIEEREAKFYGNKNLDDDSSEDLGDDYDEDPKPVKSRGEKSALAKAIERVKTEEGKKSIFDDKEVFDFL